MTGSVLVEEASPDPADVRAAGGGRGGGRRRRPAVRARCSCDLHGERRPSTSSPPATATLVGYAHLDAGRRASSSCTPTTAGRGSAAGCSTRSEVGRGRARVWAHGRRPAALAFAAARGWTAARTLWQLRRPLTDELPDAAAAGRDHAAPVRARGRTRTPGSRSTPAPSPTTRSRAAGPSDDLRLREAEPWFDPAGFLLAVTRRRLARRLPLDEGAPAARRRSARSTCSASTRRRRGCGSARR